MIELALAFNDRDGSYTKHAAAALTSVFRNTDSMINVHILHDETLTETNKLKLMELALSFKHIINFYPVSLPEDMAEALASTISLDIWTGASMYRILLPYLIPSDKIIYLDCDVIVNLDIMELWETDLGSFYLGAVHDQGIMDVAHNITVLGLNPDTYFNSGVILFELNNIRQKMNWYEDIVNFLRRFPSTTMPDQDVLNHVFGGNYLQMDQRFNTFYIEGAEQDFQNKIVHFAGDIKCWNPLSSGFFHYTENLNLTPWRFSLVEPLQPVRSRFLKKKICVRGGYVLLRKRKNQKTSSRNTEFIRKSRLLRMKQYKQTNAVLLNTTNSVLLNTTLIGTLVKPKKRLHPDHLKNSTRLKSASV